MSLKQLDIMSTLTEAIQNKKSQRHREGALFGFEMLCVMLGRLFEPYVVSGSVCLSLSLCLAISVCVWLSLSVSGYLCLCLAISVCAWLSVPGYLCLSVCLSVSLCLSDCLSVCLFVCLSLCMSRFLKNPYRINNNIGRMIIFSVEGIYHSGSMP